jgi:2-hydroxy-3-oxopropionate reductase
MVADFPTITKLFFSEAGSGGSALHGRTMIQMSTIGPLETLELSARVKSLGCQYVEAPVSGSVPHINKGILRILVGGDQEVVDRYQSIFRSWGTPFPIGPSPAASQ